MTRALTSRQQEVLMLLTRGMSNKEIARSLGIAEATTKIHLAALIRNLDVRNRTEAAFKAGRMNGDLQGRDQNQGQYARENPNDVEI